MENLFYRTEKHYRTTRSNQSYVRFALTLTQSDNYRLTDRVAETED